MPMPRILIIDDDPNLRKTLSDILKLKGYQTFEATTGAEGLSFLRAQTVQLVLVDLGLPDIPGLEVLAQVKATSPTTEAIILTGNASLDSAVTATSSGAFSYVVKPFDFDQLLLQVRRAVEKQRIAAELFLSRQMLEEVTQGITEGILLLSKDCRILWANKAALEQAGLTLPEIAGKSCHEVSHNRETPCEPPDDPCPLPELLRTGTAKMTQHTHFGKDGNRISVEVNVYPIRNTRGEINRIIHVARDVTERRRLEEERERMILELQEALNKVKTLSGLLPICASCKKIRDDKGYWNQIEGYIQSHSEAMFTHGICPECTKKFFPEVTKP
ncbi:MAG: sigma-54-dependent transcriptional regulator [Candidatus Methylomirabilia bacterium]